MSDLTDNPNKKTFKEMTDAEQGALLLAKHKGEAIQHFASLQYVDWCDWVDNNDEKFMENRIYRTKPKSKPECEMERNMSDAYDWAKERSKKSVEEYQAKLAKAVEHLEWFIENDETNRGDEPMPERRNQTWDEINSYWIEHLDAAIAFVLELKGETDK